MANNYAPATITPNLTLTLDQVSQLTDYQVTSVQDNNTYYCFISECEGSPWDITDTLPGTLGEWLQLNFTSICPDSEHIIIAGAYYCDKMRRGEFGGYVTVISKDAIRYADTAQILVDMINGDY